MQPKLKTDSLLLRVDKSQINDMIFRRIVASLAYALSIFRKIDNDILLADTAMSFKIMLGRIIFTRDTDRASALNYMDDHIRSLDSYLDSMNKTLFRHAGFAIDDIYDLLILVFKDIGTILKEYPNNNYYNKRLNTIYPIIMNMFKFYPNHILKNLSGGGGGSASRIPSIKPAAGSIFNDNWLLQLGDKVTKSLSSSSSRGKAKGSSLTAPINKFHPSALIVESMIGFSSSNAEMNALVNPFAQVNELGGIKRGKYAPMVDRMNRYLPK